MRDAAEARDERVFPNACKLVHGGASRDDRMIADHAVPCHSSIAAEDAVIAYDAFMSAVRVDEEVVMAADNGLCVRACRAIDIAILAEDIVITDFKEGGFTLVLEILSSEAYRAEGVELITASELGWAFEYDMAVENTVRA